MKTLFAHIINFISLGSLSFSLPILAAGSLENEEDSIWEEIKNDPRWEEEISDCGGSECLLSPSKNPFSAPKDTAPQATKNPYPYCENKNLFLQAEEKEEETETPSSLQTMPLTEKPTLQEVLPQAVPYQEGEDKPQQQTVDKATTIPSEPASRITENKPIAVAPTLQAQVTREEEPLKKLDPQAMLPQEEENKFQQQIAVKATPPQPGSNSFAPSFVGSAAVLAAIPNLQAQVINDTSSRLHSFQESFDFSRDGMQEKAGIASGEPAQHRKKLWGQIIGGTASQRKSYQNSEYSFNTTGFTLGSDTQFSKNLTLGVAISYLAANLKGSSENLTKILSDHYFLSFYGIYRVNSSWFIEGILGGGHHVCTNQRILKNFQTLKSRFQGNSLLGRISTGSRLSLTKNSRLIPFISLQEGLYHQKNYEEKIEQGSLHYNKVSFSTPRMGIGAKIESRFKNENGRILSSSLHLEYLNALGREAPSISADVNLPGCQKLELLKAPLSSNLVEVGAGVTINHKNQYHFSIGYIATLGAKFQGHRGTFKIIYKF